MYLLSSAFLNFCSHHIRKALTQLPTDLFYFLLRTCKFYKQVFTTAALVTIIGLLTTKAAMAYSGYGDPLMQKIVQQSLTSNLFTTNYSTLPNGGWHCLRNYTISRMRDRFVSSSFPSTADSYLYQNDKLRSAMLSISRF